MDKYFEKAFTFTLQHEGKFSTDPNDPGNWTGGKKGKGILKGTKYGISAKAYPKLDIQSLALNDANSIYYRDYWLLSGAWRLAPTAPSIAYRLFDLSVNCGISRASRLLQEALNAVCLGEVPPRRRAAWRERIVRLTFGRPLIVDGKVGPITAEVAAACPYKTAIHTAYCGEAYSFYKALDPAYLAGWLERLGSMP